MRSIHFLAWAALAACSNDAAPRLIAGGGVGDGSIDGRLNVHVIDSADQPVANATVRVGDTDKTTDEKGLVVFEDVEGPQTISVKMDQFRSAVWVGANGANVTIPLRAMTPPPPAQAMLSGNIAGWGAISLPANHLKPAAVSTSQTDDLGDPENKVMMGAGNTCGLFGSECNWSIASRTGPITVVAMILDLDTKGTITTADDTTSVIGWATRTVVVEKGVNQTGLGLTMVEAGNLETVSIDLGTPPAGLTQTSAIVGIEVSKDEVIQIPLIATSDQSKLLAPKRTLLSADGTYRLTAIAQTAMGEDGAQSIVLRRGDQDAQLAAGEWLIPPTNVSATRTSASFTPVAGAKLHTVTYLDTNRSELLEIVLFDSKRTTVDVPALVALPGITLTARVNAIGADIDLDDFSLDEDRARLFAITAQPTTVQ
ncbi:MAG TPA: carboxypeptidase-like regulatory domain-containing protein [Kofleriaceae bacterium]|nr:carboxypeptidase-like regulatory domain-containing protein [Kofleriaceae bacterium]